MLSAAGLSSNTRFSVGPILCVLYKAIYVVLACGHAGSSLDPRPFGGCHGVSVFSPGSGSEYPHRGRICGSGVKWACLAMSPTPGHMGLNHSQNPFTPVAPLSVIPTEVRKARCRGRHLRSLGRERGMVAFLE